MKHFHKKRLLKLAAFLRTVPRKNFDLEEFSEFDIERPSDFENEVEKLIKIAHGKKINCGTTACAIGWCPAVFPRDCFWEFEVLYNDNFSGAITGKKIDGKDWDFVTEFFGLSTQEASHLFQSYSYREGHKGPKSVASRIEKFVMNAK